MSMIFELAQLGVWGLLWSLGGIWLTGAAFRLTDEEKWITGLGVGLLLENWLANLTARVLPVTYAFWAASAAVFLCGLVLSLSTRRLNLAGLRKISIPWGQLAALVGLALMLTMVGRGMAILEDYQNLPTVSLMAAGDIPPHFALDASREFNYHYDTLLFATQLVSIAHVYPWMGLDIARGFCAALTLLLAYLFTRRVTRSHLAGIAALLVGLFSGGARWLMLLLPKPLLTKISANIFMLGTGFTSAPTFKTALTGAWLVDTGSPFPIPFALASGINPPWIWTFHAGGGALAAVSAGLLLLTHNRWRGWYGGAVSVLFVSILALGGEISMLALVGGFFVLGIMVKLFKKTGKFPASLRNWLIVAAAACVIAAVQGGVLTGAAGDALRGIFSSGAAETSYFSGGFRFLWPPALLSSHLGFLTFNNPYRLLAALFEIGPLVLTLPLILTWGWKTYRFQRWYESAFFLGAVAGFFSIFLEYTGSAGPTAITRVQSSLFMLPRFWAVPVVWLWARHRSGWVKNGAAALFLLSIMGGISLLGFEMIGIARPQFSTFVDVKDVRIMNAYWNKLEPDALVFDPIAYRAPTIFGRATNSHQTWYTAKPEWDRLVETAEPRDLREYGFSYAYLDVKYWDAMPLDLQDVWNNPGCQILLHQEESFNPYDFRRLYDLRNCGEH